MTATTLSLQGEAASVPAARRFVRTTLEGLGLHAACDTASTLVTELATNAVIHARSPLTISVLCTGDVVRIVVDDESLAVPKLRSYGIGSTTGRGLRLVATMATAWGVEPHAAGKRVWFEVNAGGTADEDVQSWDDEVDVDLLLAAFDDSDDRLHGSG